MDSSISCIERALNGLGSKPIELSDDVQAAFSL
jgi:hypothetical protein